MLNNFMEILNTNFDTLLFAALGGFLLWTYKLKEHYNRPIETKMSNSHYVFIHFILLLWLPFLGVVMSFIYLYNGDKLSIVLAIQVGISAPGLLDIFMANAMNKVASQFTIATNPDQ